MTIGAWFFALFALLNGYAAVFSVLSGDWVTAAWALAAVCCLSITAAIFMFPDYHP